MGNDANTSLVDSEKPEKDVASPQPKAGVAVAEADEPVGPPKHFLREYFESAVVTVIMALFGMTFVTQAVKVPTGSMQNTITIGDHLLVNKFIFGQGYHLPFMPQREIRRGDIIVFKYPGNKFDPVGDRRPDNIPFQTNFVKRVIGLPGDTIEVKGIQVLVNGQPLKEQVVEAEAPSEHAQLVTNPLVVPARKPDELWTVYYSRETIEAAKSGTDPYADNSQFHFAVGGIPAKVPANMYFAMGDSRDNSLDSRAWGFVPAELIIGRAMVVYWSYDESRVGNGPLQYLQNTRWSRTGTMIK